MAGHFGPLVPFIAALRERGDDVLLAVPRSAQERAERTAVPLFIGDDPNPAELAELWRRFRPPTAQRRP